MTVSLTPAVAPKLGPTPMLVPVVQAYMLGDFMRAFGVDEYTIQCAQQGYSAGDFDGIVIKGRDASGATVESSTLMFKSVAREASLMVDTASNVSITEQLSRRVAASILYSATAMRRLGLRVGYSYLFSAKGMANYADTMSRYGLVSGPPDYPPAGSALRQVYSVTHRPTGAHVTHASARRIG